MVKKKNSRFILALVLFSLVGQVAWIVENMYLNVFIYKIFSASASDISLMVAASAVSATLTSIFIGALCDRVGKRKLFICGGYIAWGVSIFSFALIRLDVIEAIFPMTVSAMSVGVTLVIIMDCVMTFFGSTANDAAFNAWVTDSTDEKNRGAAEGICAMMPLVAILAVFGGFMAFDLNLGSSWTAIFMIIGTVVLAIGILGIFLIKEPPLTKQTDGYLKTVFYGFSPRTLRDNKRLYFTFLLFIIFNISIQIFMPYLIIYYEVSLGMTDYVFIMAPAIIIASVITALWGRVYDKKGFRFSVTAPMIILLIGYIMLFVFRSKLPVFIGSLLMMSGYLSGAAAFGARVREGTPSGRAGSLQGVRIFTQVLLPGVIGPFVGRLILADAKTVVGSDGTEQFIPSADIFLGAAVPIVILLLAVTLFLKKDPPRTCKLRTEYEVGEVPHDYHPDPSFKRESFINLNGDWSFKVEKGEKAVYDGRIKVPFPPESELSGVMRVTKKGEVLVYERNFSVEHKGERVLLHFGAVDSECEVYVNNSLLGGHKSGYLPFVFDITDKLEGYENTLTVKVRDSLDHTYPYGKQKHKRGGMWYTPVSGIWQTVWLECVPDKYIEKLRITPTLNSVTVEVFGGADKKCLTVDGKSYSFSEDSITVTLDEPRLWTPETPHIYPIVIESGDDRVESYFALREIGTIKRGEQTVLTLNGEPYFFNGLLDQGYFPDGIYLPPSENGYRDDILRMKELGFNMLRKHIKVELPIFYYYCDTLGMAVFQDMVNNGRYSFIYDTVLPTVGLKSLPRTEPHAVREVFIKTARETLDVLYNHPSIVYYTIFNEGWGQHTPKAVYEELKQLDKTRIFDTASGWFGKEPSDVESEHVYFKKAEFDFDRSRPVILSEFGGYSMNVEGHSFNLDKVYGYKICKTEEELTAELVKLYREEIIPLASRGLSAAVYTQISDVEDETNGIMTYDRRVIKPDADALRGVSRELRAAFDNRN